MDCPFLLPVTGRTRQVTVLMPAQGDPVNVLARAMSPPHFPIKPSELRGRWRFLGIQPGERAVEGFEVLAREIPHKGGLTYGYRVSDSRAQHRLSVRPQPDRARTRTEWASAPTIPPRCELARGADLLIHDAQHTGRGIPAAGLFRALRHRLRGRARRGRPGKASPALSPRSASNRRSTGRHHGGATQRSHSGRGGSGRLGHRPCVREP